MTVAQQLYIERDGLTPGLFDRLRRLAAFANPVFHERQRLRLPVGRTPRLIACAEEHPRHLALPRGCLDDLRELLDTTPIRLELDDHRTAGDPLETTFTGTLGSEQSAAVDALAGHDTGVLVAPPGSGKTVVAAALIARRRRTTLVIVSSRALVAQWQARLTTFLDIDPADIGTIVGGRRRPTGRIDIATVQTLARDPDLDATLAPYGHVIVDECHHVPAISTEHVLRRAPARYVLGLTATPRRRDGHHPIIRMQCGPTRHRITTRPELRLTVTTHAAPPPTDPASPDATIQTIYASLAHHAARNELIARHALEALTAGRSPLILAGRLDHLQTLQALLEPHVPDLVVLHGRQRPAERRAALAGLAADRPVLVLAIGRFLGEGFDHPRLDTLFLALPVAWSGTLTQYAGRLHRPAPGKRAAEIHDYLDATIPVLERMWHKRARAYRSLGYTIATSTDTQTRDSPHSR